MVKYKIYRISMVMMKYYAQKFVHNGPRMVIKRGKTGIYHFIYGNIWPWCRLLQWFWKMC